MCRHRKERVTWDVYPSSLKHVNNYYTAHFISDKTRAIIERFVLLTYSRTSDLSRVIDSRKQLFAQKYCSLENIPLTEAALE